MVMSGELMVLPVIVVRVGLFITPYPEYGVMNKFVPK